MYEAMDRAARDGEGQLAKDRERTINTALHLRWFWSVSLKGRSLGRK